MTTMTTMTMRTVHVATVALMLTTATPTTAQPVPDGPVEVALELRAGRMVVPVHAADGTELDFLVSTGSPVTAMSASAAARVGDQALSLEGAGVEMANARTLPDEELTVDGIVMDGLLGTNTLNRFDVLFDVPGGRLVLEPIGPSVAWSGVELSEPVRLRVYHGVVLALDVVVNEVEIPAMLELGASSILANQGALDTAAVTAGVADLRLGSSTFRDVPVRLSDHPSIARFSPDGDPFVIVGVPVVVECAMAVSFVHRELRTCVR